MDTMDYGSDEEATVAFDSTSLSEGLHLYLQKYESDRQSLTSFNDNPNEIHSSELNSRLNRAIDQIGEDFIAITEDQVFDTFAWFLLHFEAISNHTRTKIFDSITSGLQGVASEFSVSADSNEASKLDVYRTSLEMYAFLLMWAVESIEKHGPFDSANSKPFKSGKSKSASRKSINQSYQSGDNFNTSLQLQEALNVVAKVLSLKLLRLWPTPSERDVFVGLLTRIMYLLCENEGNIKDIALKMRIFKCLCLSIKHHGHMQGAKTSIMQNLQYYEHLPEPMAEFLKILSEQYDYSQLAEEILR